MKTAKAIRGKYDTIRDKEIEKLQAKCLHITSKWCEEWWAIGHSTGRSLKVCDVCEKVLEKTEPNWQPAFPISESTK